jgi:hypothetical protein
MERSSETNLDYQMVHRKALHLDFHLDRQKATNLETKMATYSGYLKAIRSVIH